MEKKQNDNNLYAEYWKLASKKFHPRVCWSIKNNYKSYNPNIRICNLSLHEKLAIDDPDEILLNKRSEVISQCACHRNKYKLKALVSN